MTIKKLVNDKPLWDAFLENINAKILVSQKKLEHETSMEGIYRAQGELTALRRLTFLRDEVNGKSV